MPIGTYVKLDEIAKFYAISVNELMRKGITKFSVNIVFEDLQDDARTIVKPARNTEYNNTVFRLGVDEFAIVYN